MHLVLPLGQLVGVVGDHGKPARAEHDVVDLAEVAAGRLDLGPEGAEDARRTLGDAGNLAVHGDETVEVGRPRDPPAPDRRRLDGAEEGGTGFMLSTLPRERREVRSFKPLDYESGRA
jgi:hypothetical protein